MAATVGAARRSLLCCFPSSIRTFRQTVSRRKLPSTISRLPVELSFMQSLMPFHSATASALLTSKLSLNSGSWAWLSEGFATPL